MSNGHAKERIIGTDLHEGQVRQVMTAQFSRCEESVVQANNLASKRGEEKNQGALKCDLNCGLNNITFLLQLNMELSWEKK